MHIRYVQQWLIPIIHIGKHSSLHCYKHTVGVKKGMLCNYATKSLQYLYFNYNM